MKKKLLARYPLSNPRRLWEQDNFVFSTFSPGRMSLFDESEEANEIMRRSVKTCYDAGFNLLELGWASPQRGKAAVQMCEQLGIGIIYQNLMRYGGMGAKKVFCETNDLLGVMDEMRRWKSVVGYYLWDEPLLPEQLKLTREMMDLCERECPSTLPFTVANPSYNGRLNGDYQLYQTYIDHHLDVIDPPVMSFDYYPVGRPEHDTTRQLDESHLWCDLEYVRRAAKKRSVPFWFYYQGQNLHKVDFYIFPMIRLMMHGALLHGVKGLQNYTAWDCVVNPEDGGKGRFFHEQKQIHAELAELGRTLMALECQRVLHDDSLLPGDPVMDTLRTPMAESKLLAGKLPYRTSVSELEDAYGNDYLMVLNRDYLKEAALTLELKQPSRIYQVNRKDGEQQLLCENATALMVQLMEGGMELFRIEPTEQEPSLIEYYLEKDPPPSTQKPPFVRLEDYKTCNVDYSILD